MGVWMNEQENLSFFAEELLIPVSWDRVGYKVTGAVGYSLFIYLGKPFITKLCIRDQTACGREANIRECI